MSTASFKKFRCHRDPNSNLFLIQSNIRKLYNTRYNWVRGHADKEAWVDITDLESRQLSRDEIYNVWCDKVASETRDLGTHNRSDPDVSPYERWALFSSYPTYHKMVGNLTSSIPEALSFASTLVYISKKHSISKAIHNNTNFLALKQYLSSLSVFTRANTVKLIHGWVPTYASLRQGREPSPICPQYQSTTKTTDHILQCPGAHARNNRQLLLQAFLTKIKKITPHILLHISL
jgi:hypothetical protein